MSLSVNSQIPKLVASDFDGVLCDGLIEYFQTAWRAYCQVWGKGEQNPPDGLAEQFYRLRPVIETGWEMPVLLHAQMLGMAEDELFQDWPAIAQRLIAQDYHSPAELAKAVDSIRDAWIARDVDHWLAQHRFYPGVVQGLQRILESGSQLVIVTTKEGRFVRQLLSQSNIALSDEQIFGKEVKQPKHQTLRQLMQTYDISDPTTLWFIEDRLKTLENVQAQTDLTGLQLFLADWGYNTLSERESADRNADIRLLSLAQFAEPFAPWLA
jgi:phosphoglycolate phosphatase-like HAD superfamily hydrolase